MGFIRHLINERNRPLPPIEPAEISGKSFDVITAGNGVFVRATHPDFEVLMPHLVGPVRGLDPLEASLDLRVPRIPAALLEPVFHIANRVADTRGRRVESLFYLRYDYAARVWELVYPDQIATPGSVIPADSGPGSPFADALVELHSHHDLSLGARFSSRDDRDEGTRVRLFAVIGHTSRAPEIRLRVGVLGHFFEVPAEHLFQLPAGVSDSLLTDTCISHDTNGQLPQPATGLDLFRLLVTELPALAALAPPPNEEDEEDARLSPPCPARFAGRTIARERPAA